MAECIDMKVCPSSISHARVKDHKEKLLKRRLPIYLTINVLYQQILTGQPYLVSTRLKVPAFSNTSFGICPSRSCARILLFSREIGISRELSKCTRICRGIFHLCDWTYIGIPGLSYYLPQPLVFLPDIAAIAFSILPFVLFFFELHSPKKKEESSFLVRVERISAFTYPGDRSCQIKHKSSDGRQSIRETPRRAGILVIELWCTHDSLWMAQQEKKQVTNTYH